MYTFSNRKYRWSHGKDPRGRGYWGFIECGEEEVYWVDEYCTLTEAKKKIIPILKAAGVEPGALIHVAP